MKALEGERAARGGRSATRRRPGAVIAVAAGCVTATAILLLGDRPRAQRDDPASLRPVSAFADISDPRSRAAAIFREAGKVLLHPRCVNCHPRSDSPLQGEQSRPHEPPVARGPDNSGVTGMRCGVCHGERNFDPARVPGAPHWSLAPVSMAWQGSALADICRQIKDPKRNGNHTVAEIVTHMQKDALVGWAWSPGAGRRPAPGSWQRFGELVAAWAEAGAHCPD